MNEIDKISPFKEAELIERAGFALAREVLRSLGGGYGRRVGLIAGKGNNGKDGLVAARLLRKRGVKCEVIDPSDVRDLGNVDLVIDAAYGTGFRGAWSVPEQPAAPVIAVDIPSGVNALTGADNGSLQAEKTVTFAALKPGLLIDAGPQKAGSVVIADIGLEINDATSHLFEDSDWRAAKKVRRKTDHKWTNAVRIIAGSPSMQGACGLAARAALRAGAGMVDGMALAAELGYFCTPSTTLPTCSSRAATSAATSARGSPAAKPIAAAAATWRGGAPMKWAWGVCDA